MKIYTRRGDGGETDLFGGPRVAKDAVRVEAYGAVDETNAAIGLAAAHSGSADLREISQEVQARRELGYPPYSHLVMLRFESPNESAAQTEARAAAERLREVARQVGDVFVLGPAPAPLARLRAG